MPALQPILGRTSDSARRLQALFSPGWQAVRARLEPGWRTFRRLPAPLARGLVYAVLALSIWIVHRRYERLKEDTAAVEAPPPRLTYVTGELGGNRLRDGLAESGSPPAEIAAVLKALKPIGGARRQYKGDEYRIIRSPSGELQHVTLTRGTERVIVVSEGGKLKASRSKAPLQVIRKSASGSVKNSLWLSMLKAGLSDEVIDKYVQVFQWTLDFMTETRDGDRFSMVWVERRTPDGRVWGREVQAAVYEGHTAGKNVGVLFDDAYYDAKGSSLERIFLRAPLDYRRISSSFSTGRWHPILKMRRKHLGVDYAAERGTPVKAIGEGRVTAMGFNGGFGKRIELKHNGTYSSLYGHLQRYAAGISPGVHVRQGQVIGYVGSTGLATGPHLHFQFSRNGVWVNFATLKLPKAKAVPADRLQEFTVQRDLWLRELGEEPMPASPGNAR